MIMWRVRSVTALALATLVTTGACQDAGAPPPAGPATLRVLFVGNSLTYTNSMPATLAEVALTGGDTIRVEMYAKPNYGLIDHITLNSGAVAAIQRGGWDVVVLQQGPSTLPINRDSLVLWTRMFDSIIHPTGARTALYMVWPMGGSAGGYDAVRRSYQDAADAVGGTFIPVGVAFEEAVKRDGSLRLFGPDNFHPSALGSYLAAITIYGTLTGHDPRALSEFAFMNGAALNVPAETVWLLKSVAAEVTRRY